METDKGHIHYMIETEPTMSISKIVNMMKSYTTYHIWKRYPQYLRKHLQIKNMVKNHRLAKPISDVSWYELTRQLEYKAKWNGRKYVKIDRDGCQITCYNRSGHHVSGAEYDRKTEYKGICQKFVPTIERKGLAAVSSSFFAALCSAFGKYDVVHIHAEGPAFFSWLPKIFGKRVVVTIHGIDWKREKWKSGFGSKFIRQGEKNAVKYADEMIVLSKGVQDYFKDMYGRNTRFIPNGVNRPEVRKADLITDKFGLTKDSYILFLGRLVPEKGIRYLIEAFKNVKTNKKLVIAGGSSDTDSFTEELKELAKDDNRIIFTGFVQGQILDELYSNTYIYTLPSDLEGMPLSLLEAMSYGNCCLVSDIPECAEVVEDKALIFKKSDVKSLREKMQDACDHPEKVAKMKKQSADFICEKYNWDDVVEKTIELYRGR